MKAPKPLNAKFVASVSTPGRYGDGRGGFGLALTVRKAAGSGVTRSWVQRIKLANGKITNLGIGSYPIVALGMARKIAFDNKRAVFEGQDIRARGVPTFAEGVDAVIAIHAAAWRDRGNSERQWRSSLRDHAAPLMAKPVDAITSADVLGVLTADDFWNAKRTTAKRVRQRIGAIMKWAIAHGYREDNPAGDALGAALPKNGVHMEHHRSLSYDRVSAALAAVRASDAYVPTVLAFEFLVLTAARSGEVRGATWNEIDLNARTWTIPGERMKAGKEHRVPLSDRAIDVLTEARKINPDSDLIFPTVTGRMIQAPVLSVLLRDNGIEAVPHGFRSSFRQWTAEQTDFPREVCEHALAHMNRDQVEAAYQRSDLFEKRRALMDGWADYLRG